MTDSRISTIQALKTYEKFSEASGLYLNADKTEIVNMKEYRRNDFIRTNIYGKAVNVQTVDQLTICGKTFSVNPNIEYEKNITDKIKKLDKAIEKWKKRNLSVEGKIIVAKTFAMSQVIYMMQNTIFPKKDLKTIESKIYKYIWKGPDKIKRKTLIQSFENGGLKAPDPTEINDLLKLKQTLRTSQSDHPIKGILNININVTQPITNTTTPDEFSREGIRVFNQIGRRVLDDTIRALPIGPNEESFKVSKKHKIRIGNLNMNSVAEMTNLNPIEKHILKNTTSILWIRNLAQLHKAANEEIGQHHPIIQRLINRTDPKVIMVCEMGLLETIAKETEDESNERSRTIAIGTNLFKKATDIKTMDLINLKFPAARENDRANPFLTNRNIMHPREKVSQFMALHKKTFTNERLFRHNMIESPNCNTCQANEDLNHIIHECERARLTWSYFNEIIQITPTRDMIDEGVPDKWLNNLISLTRHTLLHDRTQAVNELSFKAKLANRQNDLNRIKNNKENFKRMCIKKKRIIKSQLE